MSAHRVATKLTQLPWSLAHAALEVHFGVKIALSGAIAVQPGAMATLSRATEGHFGAVETHPSTMETQPLHPWMAQSVAMDAHPVRHGGCQMEVHGQSRHGFVACPKGLWCIISKAN
jgi:hypothetical protein